MFNELIESKPKKQRSAGGTAFSIVFHAVIAGLLIYATAQAGEELTKEKTEEVKFVEVPKDEPPPPEKAPPPPDITVAPPPPKGFQVLTAPIDIPDKIPDVDLSKAVTNEDDFTGKGVAGGTGKGVEGGTGPVNPDQAYFEFQVEKPALALPGNPSPRYPDVLRESNVEGEVLAQFVVDTSGRADMKTFKVLKSSHDLFTASVRSVLPSMKFYPAEVGGRKVKQLVQLPFAFKLNK
jgi:periplasmic protein TonB